MPKEKRYECYDCGKFFDEEEIEDEMFLICPFCGSENVEDLEREEMKEGSIEKKSIYDSFATKEITKESMITPETFMTLANCFEAILEILEVVQVEGSEEERAKANSIIKNFNGPRHWYVP